MVTSESVRKKLLICIPAYNEAENIGAVLDNILNLQMAGLFDILVIDDGSRDATRSVCESRNVMVITHIYNMGYGAALKTAYKYASDHDYEYIIQVDADGQHDAVNIERIYHKLTKEGYSPTEDSSAGSSPPDIVIGSRFLQNSVSFHTPFYKKLVIWVFTMIIKMSTKNKITDPTSGLQGLTRRTFEFYSHFNQFAIDYPDANMIIQMALNDFAIAEIPAVMHARTKGVSMHAGIYKPIKYVVKMTLSVFIIYLRESLNIRKNKKQKV